MPKIYRLEGEKFGKWCVIEQSRIDQRGEKIYLCQCDCGTIREVRSSHLRSGASSSCGCFANALTSERSKTHGMSNSRIFGIWSGMRTRCNNSNDYHYKWYGARGIKICSEWMDDFQVFYDWSMNNGYSDDMTIDRIDPNGNYEPTNCRWISRKEQMCNTRRNVLLTYGGKTMCAKEWSKVTGINDRTICYRKNKLGWSDEKTLTTPVRGCGKMPKKVST